MLIETQYFPCIRFWAAALQTSGVKLEKYENYQKRSYRNKSIILAANGPLQLSVPLVKGKNSAMPITKVQISYEENWQKIHLQSLVSAYKSSPYFEFYIDDILPFFETRYEFLYDLNAEIIKWFCSQLKIDFSESRQYERLTEVDFRQKYLPKNRQHKLPSYVQVFSEKYDFESDLSVLDLLFCKGPEMRRYLDDFDHHLLS